MAVANTAPSDLRKRELRGAVLPTEFGRRRFCFLLRPALHFGRAPVSHVDLRSRVELRDAVVARRVALRPPDPTPQRFRFIQPQIRVVKSVNAILPSFFSNSKRQLCTEL